MLLRTPTRIALLALLAAQTVVFAQNLSQEPSTPAKVTVSAGQITVSAQNSSLNQILRDISQQTGMKITGGVNDERVYGNYGPASAGAVLAQLLDGTGTNMMLVQTSDSGSAELILTQRNGGPTPPDPNAAMRNGEQNRGPIGRSPDNRFGGNPNMNRPGFPNNNRPDQMPRPNIPGMPGNNNQNPDAQNPNGQNPNSLNRTQQAPVNNSPLPPSSMSPTPPANQPSNNQSTSGQTNSNGNLTPQQIFEQRRQQMQQRNLPGGPLQ